MKENESAFDRKHTYGAEEMSPEDIIKTMLTIPGMEHDFVVQRTMDAQDRDGIGVGISAEAMAGLHHSIISWVATRTMRYADDHGIMPQNLKVSVIVEMEG